MIDDQATHNLLWPEVRAWLIEHGLTSPEHVIEATIVIGNRDGGLGAWLDAEWYKLDGKGQPYMEAPNKDDPAKGRSSIPLRSWPPLHSAASLTDTCPVCGGPADVEQVSVPSRNDLDGKTIPGRWTCPRGCHRT